MAPGSVRTHELSLPALAFFISVLREQLQEESKSLIVGTMPRTRDSRIPICSSNTGSPFVRQLGCQYSGITRSIRPS
jgi:hypothetical protein